MALPHWEPDRCANSGCRFSTIFAAGSIVALPLAVIASFVIRRPLLPGMELVGMDLVPARDLADDRLRR